MYKLIHLSFLILVSFISNSFAQEIEWQKTIGGNNHDMLYAFEQTSDGGYICGGLTASDSSFDKSENTFGLFDYWVVKLDASGNIEWENTIGGNNYDELYTIQPTFDGGYILGGESDSDSSGDKTEGCFGDEDFWVVKLDSNGIIEWDVTIGGDSIDLLVSIHQTPDGGFILGGTSYSDSSGTKTQNCYGDSDYWIVKLDSVGTIQWDKTFGGSKPDLFSIVLPTTDHGFICGGGSESNISGNKTENTNGQVDYWVIKLDSAGNIIWQNSFGGYYQDWLTAMDQTADGGYICAGFSFSMVSGDKLEDMMGISRDYWVVKIDPLGNIMWQNALGGDKVDRPSFIRENPDGSYFCGGSSDSDISFDKTENWKGGVEDFWILKLDSIGNIIWQNTIGGNNWDMPMNGFQTNDGNFIIGGTSDSDISADKTDSCKGGYDFWIVKLTGRYNLIQGTAFVDLNSDNVKDPNEPYLINKSIKEVNTGRMAFTDNQGYYSLSVLDMGNYQVEPMFSLNYYLSNPLQQNVAFSGILQTDSLNDFAFQTTGAVNDLNVTISPISEMNPGFQTTYFINYGNVGTSTIASTVTFYPDSNLSFLSAVPTPAIITADSIVFTSNTLGPFQNFQIQVTLDINASVPLGTLINSGAVIYPITGDATPADNQNYWEVYTTGSFDPNDIIVNRNSIFDYELATPPFLEYIIRFQNTGNDTASNISIDNKIANSLELSSFEMVSSSHPCSISYQYYDSTMKFMFNNIFLPDSNVNEPASHGFIRYRIKPHGNLIIGDSILNSARINFDYNAPVLTNIVSTEVISPTGVNDHFRDFQFLVYPNPFNSKITIEQTLSQRQHLKIELHNIYGQKVKILFDKVMDPCKWSGTFDLSEFPAGVYVISISGPTFKARRIVKL